MTTIAFYGVTYLMQYTSEAENDSEPESRKGVYQSNENQRNDDWGRVLKEMANTPISSVVASNVSVFVIDYSVFVVSFANNLVNELISSEVSSSHYFGFVNSRV